MVGKTDFIVNGSFERQEGGDAVAWIVRGFGVEPAADGGSYWFRPGTPDGWSVTHGDFALETQAPPRTPSSWDGKVWGFTHGVTLVQEIPGLARGGVYDLAFVIYDSADDPRPSGLEVWWNGQKIADYASLTVPEGAMTRLQVTAGEGSNRLELRATGIVVVDDIRLFAAGPGVLADFSQSTLAIGANLGDRAFDREVGSLDLPNLPAQHVFVGGVSQPLNGVSDLIGGAAGDLLVAGAPGGTLEGRAGADGLVGDVGADTLLGGTGNDLILGGDGRGYLRGDEGADYVAGGREFDDINGNMGEDTALGGAGDDWVVGGKDGDMLSGEDGDDIVYGNLGADTCSGGAGNDLVRGGQDNDSLDGGAGVDWLSGDRGEDTLAGGAGADTFHSFGEAGLDRVLDFNRAEGDRVLLDSGTAYTVEQVGADVVVAMVGSGRLVLAGVSLSSLTGDWIGVG